MNIEECLSEMKTLQENVLDYIQDEESIEEKFQNLDITINDIKIRDNKNKLSLFLRFISNICNNHHRFPFLISKIERILQLLKESIIKNYSNKEIFNIFENSKRIILFLIEEQIMKVDEYIATNLQSTKYYHQNYQIYFAPEIKPFIDEKLFPNLPDNFNELRRIGENKNLICKLIREDSIKDFIVYVNKNNVSLNSDIQESIYETNSFINEINKEIKNNSFYHIKKPIKLIDYAAFFGSLKIFNYLILNGAELTSSSPIFAVHGQNAEIIHIIEDKIIEPQLKNANSFGTFKKENPYKLCFIESIKCNHNEIAYYFLNNFLQSDDNSLNDTFAKNLKYYNFAFIQKDKINESLFPYLCKYDYCSIVEDFLTNKNIDINIKKIEKPYFFNDIYNK